MHAAGEQEKEATICVRGPRKIRIHHVCEGGIEKSVPRITDWHHKACQVMTNSDHEGQIFLDSFSCSPLNTSFYIGRTWKRLPENPEFAKMRHGDVIFTVQWRHGSTCGQWVANMRLFVFYLSLRLVLVYQNNGNPDLVSKKNQFLGITVCHHSASLVMPNVDPRDKVFYFLPPYT